MQLLKSDYFYTVNTFSHFAMIAVKKTVYAYSLRVTLELGRWTVGKAFNSGAELIEHKICSFLIQNFPNCFDTLLTIINCPKSKENIAIRFVIGECRRNFKERLHEL